MADATLSFAGWTREKIADLVTGVSGGRAAGHTSVTLTGTDAAGAATGSHSADLAFSLAGPGDVLGLNPRAISRRYPTPGATDHESDRCPLVEFADPALPWRYTPATKPAAGTGSVHPWLVLVVGTEDELQVADERVTVTVAAQQLHPLGSPTAAYPWAHVQTDAAGYRIGQRGQRPPAGPRYRLRGRRGPRLPARRHPQLERIGRRHRQAVRLLAIPDRRSRGQFRGTGGRAASR